MSLRAAAPPYLRLAAILGVKPRCAGLQGLGCCMGRGRRLLSVSMNIYPETRSKFSTHRRLAWKRDQ